MKNFNEIYKKVYEESKKNNLEETRKTYLKESYKKTIKTLIILIVLISIMIYVHAYFFLPFVIIIVIIASAISGKSPHSSYKKEYKEIIISTLVNSYDENLYFYPTQCIQRSVYNAAEFESYDNFYSNDYINGKIDGIIPMALGDVRTEDEHTDSDGNTTYTTVFRGLFSSANLNKNIQSTIKIRSDKGKLAKLFSKKEQVEMDSQEFEKYFDIFANDKILAVRILTSDIMNYMIDFKKNNKVNFEITIKNQNIYTRIHCDDMFEGKLSQSAIDYETLHKYYKYLNFMCELNKKIYNIILEKDI